MKKGGVDVESPSMFKVICAQCTHTSKASELLCVMCGKILPFYTMNPFVIFKCTPSLSIDRAILDQYYFSLQRNLHPDKLRNISDIEQLWAEQHISQVNQAYKALQDQLLIAKASVLYIKDPSLTLENFDEEDIPTPPMGFLQKIMALQTNVSAEESDQLYREVIFNLDKAIGTLDSSKILTAIAKLTYVQRLRNLTKEIRHADSNY
jgi:hypothetical protein